MADGKKPTGTVAWLVALVVPPAVAGGLGQGFVAHHAAWAVVIAVTYEAIVAIGGFFAVVANKVSARWQDRLADRIDLFLQRKGPRFERRYRRFVLDGLRFTDTKGLATVGPFTPEHDAVFVDVSLVPRPPQQIKASILPELADERTGRHELGHFLARAEPVVLAVVGSPGSGKTTLLRHAARQACLRKRSRRERLRDIPILLYLRDHATAIITDPEVSVATLLRTTLGSVGVDESPGWFEHQLGNGRCLVLLDGLDEVAQRDDRAKVSAWAEAQVRQYPRSNFVISSRPQGYRSAPVAGAEIVQVCGFTTSQVDDFVRGWYRAVERHSTGTMGPEVAAIAKQGADDLLQRLEQAPALCDLTVNPLLLTMIANVHRYRGALPGSRADLYAEICQVMLWRRQEVKRLAQQISGDKKEAILRSLAYMMMERRVSDLSHDDVVTEIKPALRRVARDVPPDDFLADAGSNGLLIERETGQYAFAHKTFQEYLAAAHIRDKGLVRVLVGAVNDDWWAETTLLYAAKSDADPIVQACLDANSAPALTLALECVGQDSDVDPVLYEQVVSFTNYDYPVDSDLVSGVLLRQHIRRRARTSGDTHVCLRPVPSNIYRLFLVHTKAPEPDAPPAEAVGIRALEAEAFVRWANGVSDGQQAYRLPLPAELDELAARQRIPVLPCGRPPRAWIQADRTSTRTLPTLWLPPGDSAFNKFDSVSLVDAINEDLTSSQFTFDWLLLLRSRVLIRLFVVLHEGAKIPERTRSRLRASDLDRVHDLDRVLSRARSLVRPHACARAVDDALALDLALDLDGALILASARILDLDYALVLNLVHGLDLDNGPDFDRAFGLAHHLTFDRAHDLARDFAHCLDGHLSYLVDVIQPILDAICGSVLGHSLSVPFRDTQFAAAFTKSAGVNAGEHLSADLNPLGDTLSKSVKQLASAQGEAGGLSRRRSWASIVAQRLQENAAPVFDRSERVTPEKATAIRLAALCLAGEADRLERTNIGDMFRQVAVGVTLLEKRATDARYAPEVIMLAVE